MGSMNSGTYSHTDNVKSSKKRKKMGTNLTKIKQENVKIVHALCELAEENPKFQGLINKVLMNPLLN
jgi:hypothetical protein